MREQSAKIENFTASEYADSFVEAQGVKSKNASKQASCGYGSGYKSEYEGGYKSGYSCAYFSVNAQLISIQTPLFTNLGHAFSYTSLAQEARPKRARRVGGELLTAVYDSIRDEMILGLAKRAGLSTSGRLILRAIIQEMDRGSVREWNLRLSSIMELAGTKYDTTNRQMKKMTETLPEVFEQIVLGKKGLDESEWKVTRPNRGTIRQAKAMCAEGRLPGHQKGSQARRIALRAMEAQKAAPKHSSCDLNSQKATLREDSQEEKYFLESSKPYHPHQGGEVRGHQEKHGMVPEGGSSGSSEVAPERKPEEIQAEREVVQALLDLEFDPKGAEFTARQIQPGKAKQVASVLQTVGTEILAMIERELVKTPGRSNPKGILSHRLRKSPWKVLKEGGELAKSKAKRQEEEALKRAELERGAKRAGADLSGVPVELVSLLSAWCSAQKAHQTASFASRSFAWDMVAEAKAEFITAALQHPLLSDIPAEVEIKLKSEGVEAGSLIYRRITNHQTAKTILTRLGVAAMLEA